MMKAYDLLAYGSLDGSVGTITLEFVNGSGGVIYDKTITPPHIEDRITLNTAVDVSVTAEKLSAAPDLSSWIEIESCTIERNGKVSRADATVRFDPASASAE